jgi:adenine-specific DNA glycosylase
MRVARKPPRRATLALAVFHCGGRALLERRQRDGLLGGMWAFPEVEVVDADQAAAAVREIATARGLEIIGTPRALPTCEHRFTHLHATYLPFAVELLAATESTNAEWVDVESAELPALPVAQRRVLESFVRLRAAEVA